MTAFEEGRNRDLGSAVVHGVIRKPFDLDMVVDTIADCALLHHSEPMPPLEPQPRLEPAC